jgi:hypothetical protein
LNNKNPNIDQQLQDKFSEFAPMPAAFAWDQLDAKLENKASKKRRFVLFTSVAASTVAVVASSIFYFGGQSNELQSENNKIDQVVIEKSQNNKIDNQNADKSDVPTQIGVAKTNNHTIQIQSSTSIVKDIAIQNSEIVSKSNVLHEEMIANTKNEISSKVNYIVAEDFNAKQLEIAPIYFGNLSIFFLVLSFLLLIDSVQSFIWYLCFKSVCLYHKNPFPDHGFELFLSFNFLGKIQET